MKETRIDDANSSSQRSTQNSLTIDASGPSPEDGDECLSRLNQEFCRLQTQWIQNDPNNTGGGLQLSLSPEIEKKIKSIQIRYVERLAELQKEKEEHLQILSDHGWFLSPDTDIKQLRNLAESLGVDAGSKEDAISSHIRKRIDSIECELSQSYPNRSQIFHDAFEAHRAGKYTLSVPVFLTQADGIWRDQFGRNFFQTKKRESTLRDCKKNLQLQRIVTTLALLEPDKNNPIWVGELERGSSFDALNRHQVLHGESVDYATEQYSLKAISLLCCFQGICQRVAQ